jgi:hypothetical protein
VAVVDFHNSTALPDARLRPQCAAAAAPWAMGRITLRIRYSRGADFSGTCFYADHRIFVNIGRHLNYPYRLRTNLARARTSGRYWHRPVYTIELADGCELALFIFLHELYHLLVKRARRNTRQKESMCDRFAARYLVSRFGLSVRDARGVVVPADEWDFQNLEGFVAAARDRRWTGRVLAPPAQQRRAGTQARRDERQLTLF